MGFEEAYAGTPPWDIGRPQPEFLRLAEEGRIKGRVLDVGCGTGENAIAFAQRGSDVTGVDAAPTAIRRAQEKARERGVAVAFRVADALRLDRLDDRFDTVTDCGLFHVFDDADRARYERSLAAAVRTDGHYLMMAFSDREPNWGGPRRVASSEIRATFDVGWSVESIRPARFETNQPGITGHAWVTIARRTADPEP